MSTVSHMQTQANSIKRRRMRSTARAASLTTAGVLVAAALGSLTLQTWSSAAQSGRVDAVDVLAVLTAGAATGLCLWLLLGMLLAALAAVPGAVGAAAQSAADRFVPAAVHRVAAWVLTATVSTVALPATAVALPGPAARDAAGSTGRRPAPAVTFAPSTAQMDLDPSSLRTPTQSPTLSPTRPVVATPPAPQFIPERPVVRPSPTPTVGPPPRRLPMEETSPDKPPREDSLVVTRGDSLWSIVATRLGPGATDAEVAAAWPRWWAANKHVIGPDPDVLLPGQVLRPPAEVTP